MIDQNGTVFYSYLGETPAYCSGGHSAVIVTHSIDGGRSYRAPHVVDSNDADDKPGMAVRSVPGRPSILYLTWTRWHSDPNRSDIWFSRSLDGGVTFSRPAMLYSSRFNNMGSVPVVGPHNRVYVFWSALTDTADSSSGPARIFVRSSRDDGASFGAVHIAGRPFTHVPLMAMPGALRNLTMPSAASAGDGTLYVAWAQVTHSYPGGATDADIVLSRSTDAGRTWTRPRRVNDVRRANRLMPSLAVLSDGSVGVAFYDQRHGGSGIQLFAARASFQNGFHRSRNVQVSRGTSPVGDITYLPPGSTCFLPGRFFGDYIATAADPAGGLCVAWTDTQLHVPNETDVWFARVSLPDVKVTRKVLLGSRGRPDTSLPGRESRSVAGRRPEDRRPGASSTG